MEKGYIDFRRRAFWLAIVCMILAGILYSAHAETNSRPGTISVKFHQAKKDRPASEFLRTTVEEGKTNWSNFKSKEEAAGQNKEDGYVYEIKQAHMYQPMAQPPSDTARAEIKSPAQ